jgi:hypothetical protein
MAREVVHDEILCDLVDLLGGRAVRAHPYELSCFRRSDHAGHGIPDSPGQVITRLNELHQFSSCRPLFYGVFM